MDGTEKHIGVICRDLDYFLKWKEQIKSVVDIKTHDTIKRFKDDNTNTYYHAIFNINHLCSLNIDRIIDLPFSEENQDYDKIIQMCQTNLKTIDGNFCSCRNVINITTPPIKLINGKPICVSCDKEVEIYKSKDRSKGLYGKYKIAKTNGKPIDPNSDYFVLRLDDGCKDKRHLNACKKAALTYAMEMKDYMPELADDMIKRYKLLYTSTQ
jgi:hypothetical protein